MTEPQQTGFLHQHSFRCNVSYVTWVLIRNRSRWGVSSLTTYIRRSDAATFNICRLIDDAIATMRPQLNRRRRPRSRSVPISAVVARLSTPSSCRSATLRGARLQLRAKCVRVMGIRVRRAAPLQIASCVDQYASWKQRATTGSQLKDYLIAWRRHFAAIGHLVRDAAICRCRVVCQMTDTRTQMRRRPTVFFWTRVPAMLSACPPKTAPQCGVFNPFSTSCSKLLLFEGFSAILV